MGNGFDFQQQMQSNLGEVIEAGAKTNVDIVFCIDATESMENVIEVVKNMALTFDESLGEALKKFNKTMNQLRVKVIAFRDYYCDGSYAMEESDFFYLPDERQEFETFVGKIEAKGGGDIPENALEALALAMKSDWVAEGTSRRHAVVLFTDAPAHPLEKAKGLDIPAYPPEMLGSYEEMMEAWNGCEQGTCESEEKSFAMAKRYRRLTLFAPDAEPWTDMATDFEQTVHVPMEENGGCSELDASIVITNVAKSCK